MVARPPVTIEVARMTVDDLAAVHEIEQQSFSTPWPSHAYRQELEQNKLAHYLVARFGDQVVGFAGTWLLVDEAHVTTFATRAEWRRQGVGERLLVALLDLALSRGATEATLEVRPSNAPAIRLYEKFGFKVVGARPRYYTDNNEDALIMTTDPLDSPAMMARLAERRHEVAARPPIETGPNGQPVPPPNAHLGKDAGDERRPSVGRAPGSPTSPDSPASAAPTASPAPTADREPRIIRPSSISRRNR